MPREDKTLQDITREQAIRELARRKGLLASGDTFPLAKYLFDKQLAFVQDPAPYKIAVTTRRAGKTIACVADLVDTALKSPDSVCLYIGQSRKDAKQVVWKAFKTVIAKFGIQCETNEAELSLTFPNGSVVYLAGAANRTSIEDFRGLALKKVYLDEAQSYPEYIKELVDDVLAPALMDNAGSLTVIGTPGPVPAGFFYDLSQNRAWSHHYWTFFENPKWPALKKGYTHQQLLDQEIERRGVSVTDPSIQREFFGRWAMDEDSLVYKYSKEINDYNEVPQGSYTYVLGVDLGYEDADALAVVAFNEATSSTTYLVEEVITRHQDLTGLCGQIDKLLAAYPISRIVLDTGGLGKKITEEISKRYDIPMQPAEKSRKNEYIELLNDDLRTGRLKIKAKSQFAKDSVRLEWDWDKSTPDRKVVSDRFHSDICDAVLYAWRESYAYTHKPAKPAPEYKSKEWSDKQAEDMLQATIDRMESEQEAQGEKSETPEFSYEGIHSLDRPRIRYQDRFDKRRKG